MLCRSLPSYLKQGPRRSSHISPENCQIKITRRRADRYYTLAQGNEARDSEYCILNEEFQQSVTEKEGFEWLNDQPEGRTPKWGFVGDTPGSKITLKVDSTTEAVKKMDGVPHTAITISYLRSYEKMGKAGGRLNLSIRPPGFLAAATIVLSGSRVGGGALCALSAY